MDFEFKVPSTVPQDLLLIQDLIGTVFPATAVEKHTPDSQDSSDDSIASTDSDVESEDEVEAGLAPRDDDGLSVAASHSASSDSDGSSSSDLEEESEHEKPQRKRSPDEVEDEESGTTAAATYLQTKNEVVDANIMVPTITEVDPCDSLEKVGEIMSIIGNIVIVKGLPVDRVNSSERALDAGSLLVFKDRKVLGYIYETFGPTSQPFYQVKFNQHYPLDTDQVRVSREVFHVPQKSHFVFIDQLKNLRGSDASNIHDEEPAEDEIEFSDDEKEAAFRAQRRRRGRSMSSSRQSTPAAPRAHIDDMFQGTHCSTNPYDAHGPYDDDYHVTGLSRPPPVPYDDPYADVPSSEPRVRHVEAHGEFEGAANHEKGGDVLRTSRARVPSRGTRGRGIRNHQVHRGTSRRGQRRRPVSAQRPFGPDAGQSFLAAPRMVEYAAGYGQEDAIASQPRAQPAQNTWLSPEANSIQGYGQPFVQPHINPRFASIFGLNLPPEPMVPSWWASQNASDHTFPPPHEWTMHGNVGSEGKGDTYRPA